MLGNARSRIPVAEGKAWARHAGIGFFIPDQACDRFEDSIGTGPDELDIVAVDGFAPLGAAAQHQHRPAERRAFFLKSAAIREDQPAAVHQAHHVPMVDGSEG
jgi:hypothetical protein